MPLSSEALNLINNIYSIKYYIKGIINIKASLLFVSSKITSQDLFFKRNANQ